MLKILDKSAKANCSIDRGIT